MRKNGFVFGLPALALVCALVLAGCIVNYDKWPTDDNIRGGGNPAAVNKSTLADAVEAAHTLLNSVTVGERADIVPLGTHYVSAAEKAAYERAWLAAYEVYYPGNYKASTQTQVDGAVSALAEATRIFTIAMGKTGIASDRPALNTAITRAQNALAAVFGGTPGVSTPHGTRYVSAAEAADYQNAISAAQGVYADGRVDVAAITQAFTGLNTATTAFNNAIQTWTVSNAALTAAMVNLATWLNDVAIGGTADQVFVGTHYLTNAQKTALQSIINTAIAVCYSATRTGAQVAAQESSIATADTVYRNYYNSQIGYRTSVTTVTIVGNIITAGSSASANDVKTVLTAYLRSASGGDSVATPIVVKVNVTSSSQLTDGDGSDSIGVLFDTYGKYVSYDLSGSNLTIIGKDSYTFSGPRVSGHSKLVSVTLPNTLTSIDGYAFYVCDSLTSVTIPNSVTSISDHAFWRCSGLTSIAVDPGNTNYKSINGVLFNMAGTTLMQYPAGKTGTPYTIHHTE